MTVLVVEPIRGEKKMNKKALTVALGFLLIFSGILTVGVSEAEEKELEKNVEITEDDGAFFEVEIIEYTEEVKRGDEVSIEYSVTNIGDVEDTQDIVLYIEDDEIHRDKDVTLFPNETHTNEASYDTGDIDVPWFFVEFSTDLSLLLESNDDSHSGSITITQPMLEIPGFTFILLPIGVIFSVIIYHTKKR